MYYTKINIAEYYKIMAATEKCSSITTQEVQTKRANGSFKKDELDKKRILKTERIN